MRPVILSAALVLLAACAGEAPAPVEPAPAPEPAPEPEPVKAEPVAEPAMGDCVDLTFTEGAEASFGSPAAEHDEHEPGHEGHVHNGSHVKHHFEMPEGKDALVVDVTWPAETWTLDVTAGTGGCPHSGKTYASVEGAGTAHLYVPASALGEEATSFEAGSGWFVHLAHKGEAAAEPVTVNFAAKACVVQKVEAEVNTPPAIKPGAAKAVERPSAALKGSKVLQHKAGGKKGGGKAQ
jgi:hypothetical protein